MLLDGKCLARQLGDLLVCEGQLPPFGLINVDKRGCRATLGRRSVDHLGCLAPHAALENGRPTRSQSRFVDVELVRVDRTLHDGLAQPVGRGEKDGIGKSRFGVHGEHHPGRGKVGSHHPLYAHGERYGIVLEVVMDPISNSAVVVQGREDLLDRVENGIDATDVEERLLLSSERSVRQVFRRCAGSYGE